MASDKASAKTLWIIAAAAVVAIIAVQIISSLKSSGGAGPQPTSA